MLWSFAHSDKNCKWRVQTNLQNNWRASCNKLVSDFLGQIFVLVQMSSIFACDLGLNGKTLPRNFFCRFVFRFQEIFLNQHWQQMRASLILLFGKTKAFFGKDTTRKKLRFCTRYLWKRKEKPANLNRGVCFSMKWKATCQNWAHLDKEKNFGLKSHLRASCTKPFRSPTAHISNTALSLLHNKYSVCVNTANLEYFEFQVVKVIVCSSTGRRWALFWHRLSCYCVTFRHA